MGADHVHRLIEVVNPATEQMIATVPAASTADADAALLAAWAAFPSWSQLRRRTRDFVERIAAAIAERAEEITATVSADQGMPMATHAACSRPADHLDAELRRHRALYAAAEPERIGHSIVVEEPIGVCTFITPSNYPCTRSSARSHRPLVAGFTIVLKPSSETPLNAFVLAEIIDNVGLPAGVFNLVTGAGAPWAKRCDSTPRST